MPVVRELHVNGSKHAVNTDPDRSLLQVLREELDLTGSKYGCGEGRCGACTVLIDGRPTRSCTTRVAAAVGTQVRTIDGLASNGHLHPLQEAFLHQGAMQCGYCTPGMIMSGVALIESNSNPTDDDIVRFMNGNICRCGTYGRIVAAIREASQAMKAVHRE
jgi:aerobic-type carbon monoxide dehydrogenase small subunit (CoxS/CutS family)